MKAYLEIEMPTSCYYCPMTNDGFYLCKATSPFKELEDDCEECKLHWCPLIPVPQHGRLIDADALYTELAKRKSYGELSAKSALRAVANAPTIIQASGKDTDVPTREEEV